MYEPNSILNAGAGLTEQQMSETETRLKLRFPLSLRAHFMNANGGKFARQLYRSPDGEEFFLHQFIEISGKPNKGFELSWDVCHVDPGFMPEGLFPFGIDEGGSYYCVRAEDQAVIFFDPANADNLERAITEVAPSLDMFVSHMA